LFGNRGEVPNPATFRYQIITHIVP
jgi:hypothetical protein